MTKNERDFIVSTIAGKPREVSTEAFVELNRLLYETSVDKTCENCVYAEKDSLYPDMYQCSKILDSNDFEFSYAEGKQDIDTSSAYSWDYESYSSGNYVGKDFGCNKFSRREE